jgi:hypothetical protein
MHLTSTSQLGSRMRHASAVKNNDTNSCTTSASSSVVVANLAAVHSSAQQLHLLKCSY